MLFRPVDRDQTRDKITRVSPQNSGCHLSVHDLGSPLEIIEKAMNKML